MRTRLATGILKIGGTSLLAGCISSASLAMLAWLPSDRQNFIIPFLSYYTIAYVAYLTAVIRLGRDRVPLSLIWGLAIALRIGLLTSPPVLSDDVFRYIWDGHLSDQGINPYAHTVNAPALDEYAIPERSSVNHNWMASPYLPAAQLQFAVVEYLVPQSITAFQAASMLLDLGTGLLLMSLFATLRLPRRFLIIYLWNPLVVVEFSHEAHVDSWMVFLTILTFWLFIKGNLHQQNNHKIPASAISLGMATLTKGLPLLFAPLFLRAWGQRRIILYCTVVSAPLILFAAGAGWGLGKARDGSGITDGTGVFGALRIYTEQWNFNSGLYHWLETTLTGYRSPGAVPVEIETEKPILAAKLISATLMGGILLAITLRNWHDASGNQGDVAAQMLTLLRSACLIAGAYLLLTTTVHPWYVTLIIPFLGFLLGGEASTKQKPARFIWPWLYFGWAISLSYITYINTESFREYRLVRQVEYFPFYLLLAWAAWSDREPLKQIVNRLIDRCRTTNKNDV